MSISNYMKKLCKNSSAIRDLFEKGAELKQKYGANNVYDFSIGNPTLSPTKIFKNNLKKLASDENTYHGYIPNVGYKDVRSVIAKKVSEEQNMKVGADNIIMTCGAAGGLNVILKSLLNPEDEVILIAPYFMEYMHYIENNNGKPIIVNSDENFDLDISAIEKAISKKTKAIIINSPNNPTGKIYSKTTLEKLGQLLSKTEIYLISDEPYKHINYKEVPSVFSCYNNSIIVTSCAKDMSIAGERIGWIVLNPLINDVNELVIACSIATRILGFINAPAMMQKVVMLSIDSLIDVSEYEKKVDILVPMLKEIGYEVKKPDGTFYLFVKSPIVNDVAFCNQLLEYNILCVPGQSFGKSGYFRISYCCDDKTIINSKKGFENAIRKTK